MYPKIRSALEYFHYYVTASNSRGHGTHSPFVYQFITEILNDQAHYPAYDMVETLRKKLLHDKTVLAIQDLGAGSVVDKTGRRSIASIAKHAAKPKKSGQLLFRIVNKYRPQTVIELGTSLGITTSYLSLANPFANILTFEGAGAVAAIAKNNFSAMNLQNVQLVEGNFDETLRTGISSLPAVDFAFIDGNHRKEPTIEYFSLMLKKINSSSVVILDDIHWSRGMKEAWNYCKANPSVTLSIDLFFMGILFFRKENLEKQHFTIRF
ncbi:MAG: SAM-dependent methyltransferase [Sphingobacteriales bacterium UTBCD1]|jgi:predicted O-methyltransferase YrrM|nr:MAG: SAM-dependent methyltransferase [Sphingobacteriales bacterium UTBCD1]